MKRLLVAVCLTVLCFNISRGDANHEKTVFKTGFEEAEPALDISTFTLDKKVAFEGSRSLRGQVKKPTQAKFLYIPCEAKQGKTLNISFMVRSDKQSTCAVFWKKENEKKKIPIHRIKGVPAGRWTFFSGSHTFDKAEKGAIQIAAPSSFGAPPGRMWIDNLLVTESDRPAPARDPALPDWSDHVIDFPVMSTDAEGNTWLATLERPGKGGAVGVYRVEGVKRKKVCMLKIDGMTGVAAPAIAGLADGALVVCPFEKDNCWKLAFAFVGDGSMEIKTIECGGVANILPALAVLGDTVHAVWESNATGKRSILSCTISRSGVSKAKPISNTDFNSYNPTIVALKDGSLFAVWDTIRNKSADIYGARWAAGKWAPERRITSDARVERHPHLATHNNEVWMAWQAQTFHEIRNSNMQEQKIVLAKIDAENLKTPVAFASMLNEKANRLRPRISFDPHGRLWLTARESDGQHAGWHPVVWAFSGKKAIGPKPLSVQPGRWRPVNLLWSKEGAVAAVQLDDVPGNRNQSGVNADWHGTVILAGLPEKFAPAMAPLETKPLVMPETDFSLAAVMDKVGTDFPRHEMKHQGKQLALYWGDFHAHSDISICARSSNPPGHDLFANQRDIDGLDFAALTDHGYDFDNPIWAYNGEQTRNNHDPGHFVAFLGQEWTSSKVPAPAGGKYNLYGHRNLIYEEPYYHRFHDSFEGDISPSDIWKTLEDDNVEFIHIPHQLADWKQKGRSNPPTDWNHHHEHHQPVAEIFQTRGSYEYLGCPRQANNSAPFKGNYLQDAWAQGIVIGVIASPDHGGGAGKAAVWAEEFTRKSILDAIHARHTYGTSGAKMMMKFSAEFKGGTAMMGDKIPRPEGAINFTVAGEALRSITNVVIFRNNEKVFETPLGSKKFSIKWNDSKPLDKTAWYYARFQAEDEELAWSSPIWFTVE